MDVGERETQYNYGIKRMKELLQRYSLVDLQAKRVTQYEWEIQFAKTYTWQNGAQNRNQPAWDEAWLPVSDVLNRYPEIWQVFRERICSQTTISHAKIGNVINSKGEMLETTSMPQEPLGKPKKQSRVKVTINSLPRLKQEEVLPSIGQQQAQIDLTEWPSPSPTPEPDIWPTDDGNSEAHEPYNQPAPHNTGVIDLTMDETIEIVDDTVICLDDDEMSEVTGVPRTTSNHAPSIQERGTSLQEVDSDNDSLFNGPDPEEGDEYHNNTGTHWHIAPSNLGSNSQGTGNSRPLNINGIFRPASTPLQVKRGRKRALDFDEDPSNTSLEGNSDFPRKKRVGSRPVTVSSLFTAERGRVVERGRDGEYRVFDAHSSAGSALAAKVAQRNEVSDTRPQHATVFPSGTNMNPPTHPDELEDYEDEDQPPELPARSPTPDLEMQKERDKWNQVEKPQSHYDAISHLVTKGPSLLAPKAGAPPLFLLRISKERTLRLMARNCSPSHPQWYPLHNVKKEEDPLESASEDLGNMPFRVDTMWKQHTTHLLILLPEYHDLAWRASLRRQDEIRKEIGRAELKRDSEGASQLEEKMRVELASSWRLGEKERTQVIPRVADIATAESVLFDIYDGKQTVSLEDPMKRVVGGWAELVLFQHGEEIPSKKEHESYEELARMLEKKQKFLVISHTLVDEHHKHPHTLLIFASRSRTIGELCGLPEDMTRKRKSLVVVHIGRSLTATSYPALF